MSRHARTHLLLAFLGALFAVPSAPAQTIADYSRAQRALLESTMAQAAARSASMGAPAPAAAASAASSATSAMAPTVPVPQQRSLPAPPTVHVSGVFACADGMVAEVLVDATAYVLGAGQGVPGTTWQVEAVGIDRVVLERHGSVAPGAEGARKVFALPSLR